MNAVSELPLALRQNINEVVATWGFVRFSSNHGPELQTLAEKIEEILRDAKAMIDRLWDYAKGTGYVDSERIRDVMRRVLDYVDAFEKLTSTREMLITVAPETDRYWTDELQASMAAQAERCEECYDALSTKLANQVQIEKDLSEYIRETAGSVLDLDPELEEASVAHLLAVEKDG